MILSLLRSAIDSMVDTAHNDCAFIFVRKGIEFVRRVIHIVVATLTEKSMQISTSNRSKKRGIQLSTTAPTFLYSLVE